MFADRSEGRWQHRHVILAALGVTHYDFAAIDDQVLDAKPMRLHQPQPAAIEQIRDQPGRTVASGNLFLSDHNGQSLRRAVVEDDGDVAFLYLTWSDRGSRLR